MKSNNIKEITLAYKQSSVDRFELNSNTRKKVINQSLNYTVLDGKLYDTDTGEYIGDKYTTEWLQPVKIKNNYYEKKSKSNDLIQKHIDECGGFVFALFKSNTDITERHPSLNKKDIARLLYIATFVHYETGRLQKGDGSRLTIDNIHTEIRLSKRRTIDFINKLKKENIIIVDDGEVFINPEIFFKGKLNTIKTVTNNMDYIRLFKNTVRNIFNDAKENELAHIATIYSVLPYVNLNHNYICHNTFEENIEYIKPIDVNELSLKLGYSRPDKLTPHLRKLRVNNQPVFAFYESIDNARIKYLIMNPSVMYGGNKAEHLEVLKGMFVSYK